MTEINMKSKAELHYSRTMAPQNHPVMTKQFLQVYMEAFGFSRAEKHLSFRNVPIYDNQYIHEIYTVGKNDRPHLVCLHGFGATALAYLHMFEHLNDHFQVHALDNFGMGLSSRGNWDDDMNPEQSISYFIQAIEEWRKQIGITRFILVGHSFGGYIAANYAEKYSSRIQHLIFLSAAGVGFWTEEQIKERADQGRSYFTCLGRLGFNMHLRPTKMANIPCIGDKFLTNMLTDKLKLPEEEQVVWKKYIHMISDQEKVSEQGFYTLIKWPDNPATRSIEMILNDLRPVFPVDFFNGDEDWMNLKSPNRLSEKFKNIRVNLISKAGHQLTFDNPEEVSVLIKKIIYKC